jgi:pre-rRNA-processing protein TSR3
MSESLEPLIGILDLIISNINPMAVMTQSFPPTHIIRHRRENLKKCSLRGLEARSDFYFLTYPTQAPLPALLSSYLLLSLDAPPLRESDAKHGLLILDATWRYAAKMEQFVDKQFALEKRSIPSGFHTAYPRRQEDCPRPHEGLASIEAIYIAYAILGRDCAGLLDGYHWKEAFLKRT